MLHERIKAKQWHSFALSGLEIHKARKLLPTAAFVQLDPFYKKAQNKKCFAMVDR